MKKLTVRNQKNPRKTGVFAGTILSGILLNIATVSLGLCNGLLNKNVIKYPYDLGAVAFVVD